MPPIDMELSRRTIRAGLRPGPSPRQTICRSDSVRSSRFSDPLTAALPGSSRLALLAGLFDLLLDDRRFRIG